NDKCNEWKKAENMDYSLYGTPLESTTYKFAKCLQKRFGIVEGITDKNYITNSYHVHVSEPIDAFTKLKFEADFQRLSPGGAISYVEVPNMQDNLEAVMSVLQFIYDNIMYAELNTKSDYCQVCGYDGEIKIVEDDGKLVWECPKCGNRDQNKLNVARRTCGYIGTQFWNQGRTQEIRAACCICNFCIKESVLALSVTCGATSPKGRGLGKSAKFAVLPKAPTLGELAKPQGFD
ncbi:MAG: anaerobic ribonucleoside-triphosphate reductase, partial [Faecalibacterium sp.]